MGALALGLATVACSSGDDTPEASETVQQPSTETTGLPACSDSSGQIVVFGVQGVLTGESGVRDWFLEDAGGMPVTDGTPELARAYHDLGYGIIYQTLVPDDMELDGQPWAEVLGDWLQANEFPYEGPTQVIHVQDPETATQALVNLLTDDQEADAAYMFNDVFIEGLVAGGVPRDQIYTLTGDADATGTTALTREQFPDHATEIGAQPAVCQR